VEKAENRSAGAGFVEGVKTTGHQMKTTGHQMKTTGHQMKTTGHQRRRGQGVV
jgi:hypothetical protein